MEPSTELTVGSQKCANPGSRPSRPPLLRPSDRQSGVYDFLWSSTRGVVQRPCTSGPRQPTCGRLSEAFANYCVTILPERNCLQLSRCYLNSGPQSASAVRRPSIV